VEYSNSPTGNACGVCKIRDLSQYVAPSCTVNNSTANLAPSAIHLAATDHGKLMTQVASKRWSSFVAGDDDEVFMSRSLDVTPKMTEQHLIVCNGKLVAWVTIIKYSTLAITLLKLTTGGHKASCSLL